MALPSKSPKGHGSATVRKGNAPQPTKRVSMKGHMKKGSDAAPKKFK